MAYLMPNASLEKNSSDTFKLIASEMMFETFPEVISPKVYIIPWLEFRLTYPEAATQQFTPNTKGIALWCIY